MQRFQNLLFVCQEVREESHGIRQAVQLMQDNDASLSVMIYQPALPKSLTAHKDSFDAALKDAMLKELTRQCGAHQIDAETIISRTKIEVSHDAPFAVEAVRRAIQKKHDVLIKDVEPMDSGLHAVDMTLLRKCPTPVWLVRPGHSNALRGTTIGVAIDPLSEEKAGRDLAVELLKLADSMAERMDAELRVMTCWEWQWENTVRNSAFVSLPEEDLKLQLDEVAHTHKQAMQQIIDEAQLSRPYQMDVKKGKADMLIPAMVQSLDIDILIMGTVARTGIPGFLIGNTAENIIQHVNCSMLTAKPNGFVSPIQAY